MASHLAPPRPRPAPARTRKPLVWTVGALVAVAALAVGAFALSGGGGGGEEQVIAPGLPVPDLATLPVADTYAELAGAPAAPEPTGATDGVVAHPIRETPVHASPDGLAFARVEPTQFGDVWFPVVAQQDGWVQVLLPARPNGSAGWVRAADVQTAVTPYRVEVHLGSRTLELYRDDRRVDVWDVAVGGADTPTPTGRTFLLGAFADPAQDFSPVILPLGTHSGAFETYAGGPGTVAIHGWPGAVRGTDTSDGCIRVPDDALDHLTRVPLGTLVTIDQD